MGAVFIDEDEEEDYSDYSEYDYGYQEGEVNYGYEWYCGPISWCMCCVLLCPRVCCCPCDSHHVMYEVTEEGKIENKQVVAKKDVPKDKQKFLGMNNTQKKVLCCVVRVAWLAATGMPT